MFFHSVHLKDYRNYKDSHIVFDEGMNVITGGNAQGKTNIVEALYYCAFGKSFRTNKDTDIIRQGSQRLFVKTSFKTRLRDESITILYDRIKKRTVRINDVPITKMAELIGTLKVILFCPEDMRIIRESPSERRRFIDREICIISRKYYSLLTTYNKLIEQRNNLLKQSIQNRSLLDTIDIWNEKCASVASEIMIARRDFKIELELLAKEVHLELSNQKEVLEIKYLPSVEIEMDETLDSIRNKLVSNYEKRLKYDCLKGYTSIGPHKDDFSFLINGTDVKAFGSQGQKRTVILSLKIAEVLLVKKKSGENPILLLDDVMSELDLDRQKDLLRYTQGIQTIITTAEIHDSVLKELPVHKIIRIDQGTEIDKY